MKVRELLKLKDSRIFHTTRDTPLAKAVDTLNYYNVGALLVLNGEKLEGLLSEREILRAISRHQGKVFNLAVGDLMTRPVITCDADDHLEQVMSRMTEQRVRHLPVMDREKLVGIISIGDVVKAILKKTEQEARDLRHYRFGKT